jgi:hypothetical protein
MAATSADKDTEEDSDLDRRDKNTDNPEKQTDKDETLETRTQQAIVKLEEAYELQELFNIAILKWGEAQREQERLRKDLRKAEVEIERRVKAAVEFAKEVQEDTEALQDEDEEENTESEKKTKEKTNKVNKRDEDDGRGCGKKVKRRDKKNGCGCGKKNGKRQEQIDPGLEHEKQEDKLYAGIGKQLESGNQKSDQDDRPIYLITEKFKVYKCVKPNGCKLYDIRKIGDGKGKCQLGTTRYKDKLPEAKKYYKMDYKKEVNDRIKDIQDIMENARAEERTAIPIFEKKRPEREKKVKVEKEDKEDVKEQDVKEDVKEQDDKENPLLADGDEKKQYERISALYMQYRGMLVKAIQRDLDPVLYNSKYEEDKEMAAQYQEGNEREQRKRLGKLYTDYRYMLVPKWQEKLDPILWANNY